MKDTFGLLQTLEQLFAGDRKSLLTLDEFLGALHGRSYAFAIAALIVPNGPSASARPKSNSIAEQGDVGTGIPSLPVVERSGDLLAARRAFRWSDLDASDAWAHDQRERHADDRSGGPAQPLAKHVSDA